MRHSPSATRYSLFIILLPTLLLLSACATPTPPIETPTPDEAALAPTLTAAAPTPVPTWTPTPTAVPPTPTPVPTVDPAAVAQQVTDPQEVAQARGTWPHCLRAADLDNDGVAEWIGLYVTAGEPPVMSGFVLDGGTWYDLQVTDTTRRGLGEFATCELELRDVNADAQTDVLVFGYANPNRHLLHVFTWNGAGYTLLGNFEGDAWVRLEDADGDLAEEVVVGWLYAGTMAWETVYTWGQGGYAWTWERYAWLYADRPHVYRTDRPVLAVLSFYLALRDRDLPGAHALLSSNAQAAQPLAGFEHAYATVSRVEVGSAGEIEGGAGWSRVGCQVRTVENTGGRYYGTLWDVEWSLVQIGESWFLDAITSQITDQWELRYVR